MSPSLARLDRLRRRTVVGSGLPGLADQAIARAAFSTEPRRPGSHVLLAAPGGGNIGDQALLEAVLENSEGPTTLIVSAAAQLSLPAELRGRVEVLELPHLVYGAGAEHRASVARFGRALAGATSLAVVGADVMDGRYSLPASVRRATLATAAARAGVDTRIIGFSWSASARPAARRALAGAASSGVRLLVRDPVSLERIRRAAIPAIGVADVVFAARTVDGSAADLLLAGVGKPVALVNVSGLLAARGDQTADYVTIVEALRRRGLHVLLLPHVSRSTGDDVPACAAVAGRVGSADVTTVDRLLTPAQIRGLTARASVTVTGRMHLAVMSLMNDVPAVTLATQGKVEGLMQLFGVPDLCVVPGPGFAATVVEVLDRVLPEHSAERAAIHRALPDVIALARRNVVATSERLSPTPFGDRPAEAP
jgi:colanic acid/amylovoran biosynthesis protein